MCLLADSGFWSHALVDTLVRLGVGWSITVTINPTVRAVIEADEGAWRPIAYPVQQASDALESCCGVPLLGRVVEHLSFRATKHRCLDPAELQHVVLREPADRAGCGCVL